MKTLKNLLAYFSVTNVVLIAFMAVSIMTFRAFLESGDMFATGVFVLGYTVTVILAGFVLGGHKVVRDYYRYLCYEMREARAVARLRYKLKHRHPLVPSDFK